jgi:hypothetical protein
MKEKPRDKTVLGTSSAISQRMEFEGVLLHIALSSNLIIAASGMRRWQFISEADSGFPRLQPHERKGAVVLSLASFRLHQTRTKDSEINPFCCTSQ